MAYALQDLSILKKFDFERPPVGVMFLFDKPQGLRKLNTKMALCEMLVEAQMGKAFYATKEDFTCVGPLLLGMIGDEPDFESGKVGPRLGVFKDDRANRRIYQYLPRCPRNSIHYLAFAPLDKLTFEPDILIILADAGQTEILLRAKAFATGEMWTARGTPVVSCAWLYIYPYLSGEVNLGIAGVGFGTRARRLFPEGKTLITIPWDKLPCIVSNLADMEWVPESFQLGPEGHKRKVMKILSEIKRESEGKTP